MALPCTTPDQGRKTKSNRHTLCRCISFLPSLCFLLLLLWMCATNAGTVLSYTIQSIPSGYVDLTNHFEGNLNDYLRQKYSFIELNGAMAKALGLNSLNEVTTLGNGSLTDFNMFSSSQDIDTRELSGIAALLDQEDIGYLCAPIPIKTQFYDCPTAPGYEDHSDTTLALISALEKQGVRTLDMNRWYQENGWTMEDVYFKTDHHWKPQAAFAAAQQIMAYFSQHYGVTVNETMDPKNWSLEILEDWFLGSHGRRTGISYSGMDPLIFQYPKFETDYRIGRVNANRELDQKPEDDIYERKYLKNPGSYENNPYCLYLGGDYPQAHIRNSKAVNDKKLLVVGDSFRLPVECVLSTQFTELYHIDLRYYKDGTLAEYVKQIQPDLVLFLYSVDSARLTDYHAAKLEKDFSPDRRRSVVLQTESVSLSKAETQNHYLLWQANLAAGSYELTVDQVMTQKDLDSNPNGSDIFLQFALVDLNSSKVVSSRFCLSDYDSPQSWLFHVPDSPKANYAILIYNGCNGSTLGNTSQVHGLTLSQYS